MKSGYFFTFLLITVLFCACLTTAKNVDAVMEMESKDFEVFDIKREGSENISGSNGNGITIEKRAKEASSNDDQLNKGIIEELMRLGCSATTIASALYDGNNNAAISKLYSEMRRLGFSEDQISSISSNGLSLKKGAIYTNNKAIGIWNGKDAYILNSKGNLVKSSSYTKQVKQAIAIRQTRSSNVSITTTNRIIKFVDNIASNKLENSAVNSLSRIHTKAKKGTLALKLLAADIATSNLGAKKFTRNNVFISSDAIKSVLNTDFSRKYIARKDVKVDTLRTALAKGKAILRIRGNNNQWGFIAISKVSKKSVTVYENKKSQKVAISSLSSHLNRKYRFSGVAITYNVKIGKTPSNANLKAATGI